MNVKALGTLEARHPEERICTGGPINSATDRLSSRAGRDGWPERGISQARTMSVDRHDRRTDIRNLARSLLAEPALSERSESNGLVGMTESLPHTSTGSSCTTTPLGMTTIPESVTEKRRLSSSRS